MIKYKYNDQEWSIGEKVMFGGSIKTIDGLPGEQKYDSHKFGGAEKGCTVDGRWTYLHNLAKITSEVINNYQIY